jgi:hypothetical protein
MMESSKIAIDIRKRYKQNWRWQGATNIATPDEDDRIYSVYNITYPLPWLTTEREIMIEATSGVTHQKSRPLWQHEAIAALGHQRDPHKWTGQKHWTQTYEWIGKTTPRHTWERIIATLHSLELEQAEHNDTEESIQTPEKDEAAMTMVARVINRWRTLPEPTNKEDWQAATDTDHDLTRIKQALTTKSSLSKASIHEKRYYKEWSADKLEL